jgi:tetratricopeptide (TPR) repeat protein
MNSIRLRCFLSVFIIAGASMLSAQERPDALRSYRLGRDFEARGLAAESERHYNEAVRICTAELARNEATMDTYVVLAWTLQRQQKYAEVISWGEKALAIKSDDYRIVETMGEAYFYLNRYADSLRAMEKYVSALPQGDRAPTAYFFIGEIYRAQRKFRHADIAYTTAVRLESGVALWWYRLGLARESLSDYSLAIEAYERSLRLNPNYPQAAEALARVRKGV